jgi:hypothetical protein
MFQHIVGLVQVDFRYVQIILYFLIIATVTVKLFLWHNYYLEALDTQCSVVNLMLQDIRYISWSFDEFTFVYVNRTCNKLAHECARQVANELDWVEWHLNPLNSLRNLLEDDCNHVLV